MCNVAREGWRAALFAALAAGLAPAGGRGQALPEVERRIDRMEQAFRRAQANAARADSVTRLRFPAETIRAGGLTVLAARSVAPLAAPAAESAARVLDRAFGRSALLVATRPFQVYRYAQLEGQLPAPEGAVTVNLPAEFYVTTLMRSLVHQASVLIAERQDSTLSAWLRATFVPYGIRSDAYGSIYLELVTTSWSKAHGCYVGDLAACRAALGVAGREDPIVNWYDGVDRRLLAAGYRETPFWNRLRGDVLGRCARGSTDEPCIAALRDIPRSSVPAPLSASASFSLLETVLDVGGRDAYGRLLSRPDRPLEGRLAAAAGLSSDSLFALWRHRVLAARPRTVGLSPGGAWAAVLWSTILGILALRSTRWR